MAELTRLYPNIITADGTDTETGFKNDDAEIKRILQMFSQIDTSAAVSSNVFRNSVITGPTIGGKPSYITASDLIVSLNGSVTSPIILTLAAGFNAVGAVDKTITITDRIDGWNIPAKAGTYYIYITVSYEGLTKYEISDTDMPLRSKAPDASFITGNSALYPHYYYDTIEQVAKLYDVDKKAWVNSPTILLATAVVTTDANNKSTITRFKSVFYGSTVTAADRLRFGETGDVTVTDGCGNTGNLYAAAIHGYLIGDVSGNLTGTATTAKTADTATTAKTAEVANKAAADSTGAIINTTYFKNLGGTVTGALILNNALSTTQQSVYTSNTDNGLNFSANNVKIYSPGVDTLYLKSATTRLTGNVIIDGYLQATADKAKTADVANNIPDKAGLGNIWIE